MLRSLGYDDISRYHMNEATPRFYARTPGRGSGPAGRKSVQRRRHRKSSQQVCLHDSNSVPAGHDRFPIELLTTRLSAQTEFFDLKDASSAPSQARPASRNALS